MNGRVLLLGAVGMLALAVGVVGGTSGSAGLADHNNISSAQLVTDGTYDEQIPGSESVYYKIELSDKEQVNFTVDGASENVQLTLFGPDQVTELRNDGGGINNPNARIIYTANQNGTFYLEATTNSDTGTAVSLFVDSPDLTDRFEPNDVIGAAAPLSDGQTDGLQLAGEELDYYAVTLNDSEQVTFSVTAANENLGIRLFGPDQVTQLQSDNGGINNPDATVTYTANREGTFYFEVDSNTDRSTSYSVAVETPNLTDRFEPNDAIGAAAPLSDGQTDGLQLAGEELDYYAVTLNDSEQVTFSIANANENLGLRLFGPDQVTELRSDNGGFGSPNAMVTYTANQNATFYFEVDSNTDRSTGYSVSIQTPDLTDRFEPNDGFSEAATLSQGQYRDLQLAGEELDYYAVTLNDSEQVTLSVTNANENLGIRLFGPDQVTELRSDNGGFGNPNAMVTYTANQNATFYFEVDSNTDRSTSYSVSVETPDLTDRLEPNDEFSSAPLTTVGRYMELNVAGAETDFYYVPLNATQELTVEVQNANENVLATLYDADGTELTSDDGGFGNPGASFTYTAEQAGAYYVGITTRSNRSTGYTLIVNSNESTDPGSVPQPLGVSVSPTNATAGEVTDIAVTVTNARNGDAVEDATVSVPDLGPSATTNASGVATLSVDAPSAGEFPVSVSADGYADASATLTVESANQIPSDAVYSAGSAAAEFDDDRNGQISVAELRSAAVAYATGGLEIDALRNVATAFALS